MSDLDGAKNSWPLSERIRTGSMATAIFCVLLLLYQINGDFLPGGDAKPNVYFAINLMETSKVTFAPSDYPFMFVWTLSGKGKERYLNFDSWDSQIGELGTARELFEEGRVELIRPKYYITPTRIQDPDGGTRYANVFGFGAGLLSLPFYRVTSMFVGDLGSRADLLWPISKLVASASVAGSAVFVFLAATMLCPRRLAFALALAYGAGTCVWSTSSQALWQHGPDALFLSAGAWCLICSRRSPAFAWFGGASFAAAMICRPTSALVLVVVGAALGVNDRGRAIRLALGAAPLVAVLVLYNVECFGSLWKFGQTETSHAVALAKTGSGELWQTPLVTGLAGLTISPSRGLLVYSPWLALGLVGLALAWRRDGMVELRAMGICVLALVVVAAKWFDWWGGWCFGYRPLLGAIPFLAILAAPLMEGVLARRWLRLTFMLMIGWSLAVQGIGAFAYNVTGWNSRTAFLTKDVQTEERALSFSRAGTRELITGVNSRIEGKVRMNIDEPDHRHRLWSVTDSQIVYYLGHLSDSRLHKRQYVKQYIEHPSY